MHETNHDPNIKIYKYEISKDTQELYNCLSFSIGYKHTGLTFTEIPWLDGNSVKNELRKSLVNAVSPSQIHQLITFSLLTSLYTVKQQDTNI